MPLPLGFASKPPPQTNPRPYLYLSLNFPECHAETPVVFPQIKELTISHPKGRGGEGYRAAIVALVMSHHARGMPFERMVIRLSGDMLGGMENPSKQWIGSVEWHFDQASNGRP